MTERGQYSSPRVPKPWKIRYKNKECVHAVVKPQLVKTDKIGDIELSQWKDIIKYLIERDDEQQLQKDLFSWVKHTCRWLHTQKEQEEYSLSLHASRIFDRKEWIDYVEFNKLYRPEVLMGTMKGVAQNECESKD
mgnify:CR=1 FL=1